MSGYGVFSTGSQFEAVAGYARARQDGEWVFVAGTTGFDYAKMTIPDALESQVLAAIENISQALIHYDCSAVDVVQCNWVITNAIYFSAAGPLLKKWLSPNRPVMMTLVCGLVDPRMKFEMQVVAHASGKSICTAQ